MVYSDPRKTLAQYLGSGADRGVGFSCSACGVGLTMGTERVIAMLRALGLGDELSAISQASAIGDAIGVRCVRCGSACWEAWPIGADRGSTRP